MGHLNYITVVPRFNTGKQNQITLDQYRLVIYPSDGRLFCRKSIPLSSCVMLFAPYALLSLVGMINKSEDMYKYGQLCIQT